MGVLFGVIAFAVFLIPIFAVQYRLYGRFTPLRLLGAAAVSIYGAALLAYTLLPLPSPSDLHCSPGVSLWEGVQTTPLQFVSDIARETAGLGVLTTLKSTVVLQVVFNVVLFLPWGMIARRFLGRNVLTATLTGFAASLLIETTQATGAFGVYPCAYRLGDVDDLIANTAGALLGALLAPAVLWFFPRRREFEATRSQPRPVTAPRRWLGMLIDLTAFHAIGFVLIVLYRVAATYVLGVGTWLPLELVLAYAIPGLLVFYLPAFQSSGSSLGQRAVWLEVSSTPPAGVCSGKAGSRKAEHDAAATDRSEVAEPSGRRGAVPLGRRLLRATVVGGLYVLLQALAEAGRHQDWAGLPSALSTLLLVVAFVSVLATRTRRGLSGKAAGTYFVDSRS
ncbi:VanZ family protein [Zhihengliuella sp.]|uniref:VanZ family protein n=1 Tax=Zhihengliuella sp. TaxID=1954483 RepID=UPI002811CCF5|nr:VanZ family protein [Zhihengliuella sp.]